MILNDTLKRVRIKLSGPHATNPARWFSAWADHKAAPFSFAPDGDWGDTNGATEVVMVAAPSSGFTRQIKYLAVFNDDTAPITVTIEIYDGTTARSWIVETIPVDETLEWSPDR